MHLRLTPKLLYEAALLNKKNYVRTCQVESIAGNLIIYFLRHLALTMAASLITYCRDTTLQHTL